jgi:hypothetical protein
MSLLYDDICTGPLMWVPAKMPRYCPLDRTFLPFWDRVKVEFGFETVVNTTEIAVIARFFRSGRV